MSAPWSWVMAAKTTGRPRLIGPVGNRTPKIGRSSRCAGPGRAYGAATRPPDPEAQHGNRSPSARRRAQGPPPRDVGVRRLPVDGRDVPASARPPPRRGVRHRARHARPGRGRRHGQRVDPRRPGATVTASDLTPELLEAGRRRADGAGVELEWAEADAERLPFEDATYDAVLSSIGAMFAPNHEAVAGELVRVCRPGGTIGLLSWTPEGMIGDLFRTMGPFAPPPPPGAQPPPLWGSEAHVRELFGDRVALRTLARDTLDVSAFARARDYGEHFKARYGPTIAARKNAAKDGRDGEFDAALDAFCDRWNRGTDGAARFEMEYLLAVGTRL